MEFVQVDNRNLPLLRKFFDVLWNNFAETEMDNWDLWVEEADWSEENMTKTRSKKLAVVALDERKNVVGGTCWEYFRESQHYLFSFLYVGDGGRGRGLGLRLGIKTWKIAEKLEREHGHRFSHLFCEMHDPSKIELDSDSIDPLDRIRMFSHMGVKLVKGMEYFQPPLHKGDKPQPMIFGIVLTPRVRLDSDGSPYIPREQLVGFLSDYYHDLLGGGYEKDPTFQRIIHSIPAEKILALSPINVDELMAQAASSSSSSSSPSTSSSSSSSLSSPTSEEEKRSTIRDLQRIREQKEMKFSAESREEKKRVVVIGAGIAGLACARELMARGYEVLVVEGRNRLGGRVWTTRLQGEESVVDCGAAWIHGTEGNQMCARFREEMRAQGKNLDLHSMPITSLSVARMDQSRRKNADKGTSSGFQMIPMDEILEALVAFETLIGRIRDGWDALKLTEASSLQDAIEALAEKGYFQGWSEDRHSALSYMLSRLESEENTSLETLSAKHFDSGETYEGGDHFVVGGLRTAVQCLGKGVRIHFGQTVTKVKTDKRLGTVTVSMRMTLRNHIVRSIECDYAVVTVPLGVLKASSIEFSPTFPASKAAAVHRMGFGQMDKVILRYEKVFWPKGTYVFGYNIPPVGAATDVKQQGTSETNPRRNVWLFNLLPTTGDPVLVALITGQLQKELSTKSDHAYVDYVCAVVDTLFCNEKKCEENMKKPFRTKVVRWGMDSFSLGAYSFMKAGASMEDIEQLGAPVHGGRVLFAGEHTSVDRYGYMDGAYMSGLREAQRISSDPSTVNSGVVRSRL